MGLRPRFPQSIASANPVPFETGTLGPRMLWLGDRLEGPDLTHMAQVMPESWHAQVASRQRAYDPVQKITIVLGPAAIGYTMRHSEQERFLHTCNERLDHLAMMPWTDEPPRDGSTCSTAHAPSEVPYPKSRARSDDPESEPSARRPPLWSHSIPENHT